MALSRWHKVRMAFIPSVIDSQIEDDDGDDDDKALDESDTTDENKQRKGGCSKCCGGQCCACACFRTPLAPLRDAVVGPHWGQSDKVNNDHNRHLAKMQEVLDETAG